MRGWLLLPLWWLAGCAGAPDADPTAVGELRILAYNIKRGLGNDGVTDIGRAAALIAKLQPDLVALQEIDVGVDRSGGEDQMAKLAELTGMEGRFGPFMAYGGGQYGIGLLSRLPIVGSANHPLPDGAEPRTALDVVVALPNGDRLTFCSVHLYRTEAERLAQAERLVEIYGDAIGPMVLAGDFNSIPGSPVMDALEAHWVNPEKGEDNFTFHAARPDREIDAILFRPRHRFEVIRIDVLDEPVISDHRPVWLELRYLE